MVHIPFSALITLPAGSDAEKGFYGFGVAEGKQLNIAGAGYLGGDSNELYLLVIVPVSATASLNDVDIDQSLGMVPFFTQMKGGATAPLAEPPGLTSGGNRVIPGPCSVLIQSNDTNTAVFTMSLWGTMSDLGEGL